MKILKKFVLVILVLSMVAVNSQETTQEQTQETDSEPIQGNNENNNQNAQTQQSQEQDTQPVEQEETQTDVPTESTDTPTTQGDVPLETDGGDSNWNYINRGRDWTWECQGSQQSPIDIEAIKGSCDNSMIFDFNFMDEVVDTDVEFVDNVISIKGQFAKLYATDILGKLAGYNAYKMTIHSPSEHKLEGHLYDGEIQIYHEMRNEFKQEQQRTQAIVSIFLLVDDNKVENPFIEALNLNNLNSTLKLNTKELLGDNLQEPIIYFMYEGSQNQPPCYENTNWFVLEKPLYMQTSQLAKFNQFWKNNEHFAKGNGNNRITMPQNERLVKKGGIECQEQFVYFFSFFILYIFINYFIFKLL